MKINVRLFKNEVNLCLRPTYYNHVCVMKEKMLANFFLGEAITCS